MLHKYPSAKVNYALTIDVVAQRFLSPSSFGISNHSSASYLSKKVIS